MYCIHATKYPGHLHNHFGWALICFILFTDRPKNGWFELLSSHTELGVRKLHDRSGNTVDYLTIYIFKMRWWALIWTLVAFWMNKVCSHLYLKNVTKKWTNIPLPVSVFDFRVGTIDLESGDCKFCLFKNITKSCFCISSKWENCIFMEQQGYSYIWELLMQNVNKFDMVTWPINLLLWLLFKWIEKCNCSKQLGNQGKHIS